MFRPLNQPIRQSDWQGLRVWIIGASTGIGAALAQQLASLGASLVLTARQRDTLDTVADRCRHYHEDSQILVLPFDVSNTSATTTAVEEIRARWGSIDLVIFNAGTYTATRVDTLSANTVEVALRVNLIAPISATAGILPLLLQNNPAGRTRGFAFVASVAGYRGLPRALTYGPGKAGLNSFAESLWIDLNGLGLNTWVINPGFVRTRLTAQNSFEMPALIEPEDAASAIIAGFATGKFEIHFPKRFTYFMKLLQLLPIGWYLRLAQRLVPPLCSKDVATTRRSDKEAL
jgi:short-subunit dehydrogenase